MGGATDLKRIKKEGVIQGSGRRWDGMRRRNRFNRRYAKKKLRQQGSKCTNPTGGVGERRA